MHILVFPSFYPSPVRPQSGIFFKEQVMALRKAGHQVGVIVAPRLWETLGYIRDNRKLPNLITAVDEGDSVYRMHWGWFPRVFPLICAALHGDAGFRAFNRYVQEQGMPDLIHAHNTFYSGYMAVRIAKKYDLPVVLTEHSSNFLRGRIFLPGQHMVVKYTLNRVDAAFAVGQRLANKINKRYHPPEPLNVIKNIVDTEFFQPSPRNQSRPFTFAAVGQMKPIKRYDLLIDAFGKAFKGQDVRLVIGGRGSEQATLIAQATRLGIHDQVELPGLLSRDEVRDLFQHAHVVVSSSDIETFGITLIEGMSCGKPVISTRSGGPEDFVTPDVGILVPTDDIDALSGAMQTMINNYDDYKPKLIRTYCEENFSERSIVGQLETIYQKLLS